MSDYQQDEQLLLVLQTGDTQAWQQLYSDMRSPFRLFFLRYTQEESEIVLELYQDAMVVLHRKVTEGSLVAPLRSSLKTYLIGIGKMLYRKRRSQQQWTDEIPEVAVPAGVEDRLAQAELAQQVQSWLQKLEEGCREVLTMVYLRGYSMEAVMERLSLPSTGAARKRKFDCLKKLRKLMPAT